MQCCSADREKRASLKPPSFIFLPARRVMWNTLRSFTRLPGSPNSKQTVAQSQPWAYLCGVNREEAEGRGAICGPAEESARHPPVSSITSQKTCSVATTRQRNAQIVTISPKLHINRIFLYIYKELFPFSFKVWSGYHFAFPLLFFFHLNTRILLW